MSESGKARLKAIAEAPFIRFDEHDWEPDSDAFRKFVEVLSSPNWQSRKIEGGSVTIPGCGLNPDLAARQQLDDRVDGLGGASVPHDQVGPLGTKQGTITNEPANLDGEILEGGVIAAADAKENLGFHRRFFNWLRSVRALGRAGQAGKEAA